jgi:uncharacterized protein (DUF302 family)
MASPHLPYAISRTVSLPVEEADLRIRDELQKEGFGILTEIDVRDTLKKKLDVDFRPYKILGACNPPLAHQALTAETNIGLLLPCNVIVYEGEEEGTTVVAILDPLVQLGVSGRDDIGPLGEDAKARLERALAAL